MTPLLIWVITLVVAYLIGSIPTGFLLVRTFSGKDIRETGSGNIGATNVARSGAKGLGIATLVLDTLKGLVAVMFAQHMGQRLGYPAGYDLAAVAGLVVIFAHIFPVWLSFRGGKGVATALGVFIGFSPLVALTVLAVFAAVFALTRFVSLASMVAGIAFALLALIFDTKHCVIVDLVYIAIPLLVIAKHHGNVRRLMSRTEPKFGVNSAV